MKVILVTRCGCRREVELSGSVPPRRFEVPLIHKGLTSADGFARPFALGAEPRVAETKVFVLRGEVDGAWEYWEAAPADRKTVSVPCPHHLGEYVSDKTCYLCLYNKCGNEPCTITKVVD